MRTRLKSSYLSRHNTTVSGQMCNLFSIYSRRYGKKTRCDGGQQTKSEPSTKPRISYHLLTWKQLCMHILHRAWTTAVPTPAPHNFYNFYLSLMDILLGINPYLIFLCLNLCTNLFCVFICMFIFVMHFCANLLLLK